MKKSFFLLATFCCALNFAIAQLQIGFQTGMNLPTAGVSLPNFVEVDRDGTQHVLVATMGAGLNFNASLGYQLHPNVVANIDLGYFKSFQGSFHAYQQPGSDAKFESSFSAKFSHVTPSIVFMTNPGQSKFQTYARFGVIIGWATVDATTTPSNIPGLNGSYVVKYSGGTSMGFLGGLGVKRRIGEKLSAFVELNTKTVTAYPKKLENIRNFDGMETAPTIHYKKKITPDSPSTDQLIFPIPYSSFGLSLGVIYSL